MKRQHRMPFGAEFTQEGKIRFRLWAPAARQTMLFIDDRAPVSLQAQGDGWYEWISEHAHAGSRYYYQIDNGLCVPDPASRYNPDDVHRASQVIDPAAFEWQDEMWLGRPWQEAVIYEIHVGTFTPEGTFAALEQKLDYLADLGVTGIELMPIADFPGQRNWGYDGTLLFAPDKIYGTPDDLKRLIQSAHRRHLMVLLDVVYNHFGPEGNYLHVYAPQFFTERHHTPWGAAINFDSEGCRVVRDFYIHNALYWLEEYHFDGLRLDAVHTIADDSQPDILEELAQTVRATFGAKRHIHLILENDHNAAHYLTRRPNGQTIHYDAQWNDDVHHAYHVLLTHEYDGYYADYADAPIRHLGRCLTEGFAYQGEISAYRHGESRGEPSVYLPPSAFVAFLQNHDQIGNRAFGERLATLAAPEALRAATILFLLSPSVPLLFMGEEWGARESFLFFCGFSGELAQAVTIGRRKEFTRFERFHDLVTCEAIPDPCAASTFERAKLNWQAQHHPPHHEWLALYQELLALRQRVIVPRLGLLRGGGFEVLTSHALRASWQLGDETGMSVYANLGATPARLTASPQGRLFYGSRADVDGQLSSGNLLGFTVGWYLKESDREDYG
ncbi:malto-oligosyltrehalose trehalohydrolase [Nitrosomonas sp. Nm34]|uniref:malto-oligosyltrehalose trehalohydrolase n=1 Tax=Nitrosomonas sp. Nm34 TaxID=1881055 RepID=UPI0008ECD06C|nr:malto-oligosyltrehalose trehalohydrolase [Nitrosomonas sp. Nm34]SFI18608.1 1,4-alpha-glucan branching enzyme/maltooligosyltrehalose trehalohydrolase [Nitrosomonas sp. Nm34]